MTLNGQLIKQKSAPRTPAVVTDSAITLITPPSGELTLNLRELWQHLDLLYLFVWREIKTRYKQTIVGAAWAIIQPLVMMGVLSLFFGWIANAPSQGIPYPLFVYSALVPWTYLANAMVQVGISVVNGRDLITKVYFPRLLIPLAQGIMGLADFFIALVILLGLILGYGLLPSTAIWVLPIFILLTIFTALGVGLWLAALNVRYRDVGQIIPFISQVWFFATPIAYPSSVVPEQWHSLYSLNPMVGVVEGFRWALLGQTAPPNSLLLRSALAALLIFISGVIFFRLREDSFADEV
jgi:lipopolysaccharide transport system permease protein